MEAVVLALPDAETVLERRRAAMSAGAAARKLVTEILLWCFACTFQMTRCAFTKSSLGIPWTVHDADLRSGK